MGQPAHNAGGSHVHPTGQAARQVQADGTFCNASGPLAVPTEGVGWSDTAPPREADDRSLVLFDSGDEVVVQAGDDGVRFLLVSGRPLGEPVAWYGPIVMNTQDELRRAFEELEAGTFLKSDARE